MIENKNKKRQLESREILFFFNLKSEKQKGGKNTRAYFIFVTFFILLST